MTKWLLKSTFLIAAVCACRAGEPKWTPPDRQCPGALRPVWMADPNYSMCVVTSFRTHDLRTWERERPGTVRDVLTVDADVSQAQVDLTGGWPPHLAMPKAPHANDKLEVDTVVIPADTIAGGHQYTEVGRRSGIAASNASTLEFVSGIRTGDGRYVIARGQSVSAATVDTLLLMFRTVMRSKTPDPNPR
jgi:hypothetical protein